MEGGVYISPEFQLGQVYDGGLDSDEDIILYQPVYVCVPHQKKDVNNLNNAPSPTTQKTPPTQKNLPTQKTKVNTDGKVTLVQDSDEADTEKMTSV